jgi:hypothetical protein
MESEEPVAGVWPSVMFIYLQNSYAPRGKRRPGRREAQNRGKSEQSKNPSCMCKSK